MTEWEASGAACAPGTRAASCCAVNVYAYAYAWPDQFMFVQSTCTLARGGKVLVVKPAPGTMPVTLIVFSTKPRTVVLLIPSQVTQVYQNLLTNHSVKQIK